MLASLAACDPPPPSTEREDAPVGQLDEALGALCERHSDCASDLCDSHVSTRLGIGFCIPESRVLYVDPTDCAFGEEGGDGSRDDPFCLIRSAVQAADDTRRFVRVYPGFHFPFGVLAKQVSIFGPDPDEGVAEVTEEDVSGSTVGEGSRVLLDRLALGRHSRFGVRCSGGDAGASLDIRRSEILSDLGVALIASGCDVRLDRDVVAGFRGGLQLAGARHLVTNTAVTGAVDGPAVLVNGGTGQFLLTTITGNGEPGVELPAVRCLTQVQLEDSIVVGNSTVASGSQLEGDCRLARVVVGSSDSIGSPGAIRLDPELDGFRLPRTPANQACCIDRAPIRPFVRADIEGTPRPQGVRFDIGADESDAR
jgi:hypothetical protein